MEIEKVYVSNVSKLFLWKVMRLTINIKEEIIMEKRKVVDSRKYPSEKNCSLTVSGKEEVLPLAVYHAVTARGHKDTPLARNF